MTGFDVKPEAVALFSKQVHRQYVYARDLNQKVNLESIANSPGDKGLLADFTGEIQAVQERARAHSVKATNLLRHNAESLAEAAKWYEKTDREKAEDLDKTYREAGPAFKYEADPLKNLPPIERYRIPYEKKHLESPEFAGKFGDVRPQSWRGELKVSEPSDKELVAENFLDKVNSKKIDVDNALSAAWWIRSILTKLLGKDVLSSLSNYIAGDWNKVGKLALAFKLHSAVFHDISVNTKHGMFAMQTQWEGRAADQMQTAMYRLVDLNIDNHSEFLYKVHEKIWSFAQATYHTFVLIEEFVNFVIDAITMGPFKIFEMAAEAVEKLLKGALGGIKGKWDKLNSELGQLTRLTHVIGALAGYHGAGQNGTAHLPWPKKWDHPAENN